MFQREVVTRRLKHGPSAMLLSAITESKVDHDASGNPFLTKDKTGRGRIDCLQASVIAVGMARSVLGDPDIDMKEIKRGGGLKVTSI